MTTFAQTASAPVAKDSTTNNQKFYFPAGYYTDSAALSKALPKLASQVLAVYHDDNKRTYYENSIPCYLLIENYTKAMSLVDSGRKMDDDNSYGIDNPNIALIKELQNYGVKIIVCGQAMTFLNLEMEDVAPGIKQALNAQTVISSYQLKNYVYFDMSLTE